ncbi:hypothetical protein V1478_004545 [Vespula squamosa]|uniref:Uncharacterized protein n=1 Tax=Vespula squamosa TaxID=30214 RepID=A0ABD2BGI2_VESSQ
MEASRNNFPSFCDIFDCLKLTCSLGEKLSIVRLEDHHEPVDDVDNGNCRGDLPPRKSTKNVDNEMIGRGREDDVGNEKRSPSYFHEMSRRIMADPWQDSIFVTRYEPLEWQDEGPLLEDKRQESGNGRQGFITDLIRNTSYCISQFDSMIANIEIETTINGDQRDIKLSLLFIVSRLRVSPPPFAPVLRSPRQQSPTFVRKSTTAWHRPVFPFTSKLSTRLFHTFNQTSK